jgi:hypothetical protein
MTTTRSPSQQQASNQYYAMLEFAASLNISHPFNSWEFKLDNPSRYIAIFKPKSEFSSENELAISLLVRPKSYFEPDGQLITEAMMLLPNSTAECFLPHYPMKYGYNFEDTPLFENVQEIIDHLCDLTSKITPQVTNIQFGDFDPE